MLNTRLLPWQEADWRQLCEYFKRERIPQALLISGNKGIGKLALARRFAYSLLCERPDGRGFHCAHCRYCALLEADSHPDYSEVTLEDDKSAITINQIRAVVNSTCLKPQYDRQRVIIIQPADKLTVSAANAFLKCLEEPGERTLFILVTDQPNKLPGTIVSRCQRLTARAPGAATLAEWLSANKIVDERVQLAGLLRAGIMTHERFLDDDVFRCRQECFKEWQEIAAQWSFPAIIAEKWDKLPKMDLINWMLSWVADIIKQKSGIEINDLYNPDIYDYTVKLSSKLNLQALFALYDKLLNSRSQVDMQLNTQSMLEEILINWQELNRMGSYG